MVSRARALSSLFSPSRDVGGEIQIGGGPAADPISDINSLPLTGNSIGDQAFVTSTNRLYIWNGNGWYNIALINESPSAISGVLPSYNLAIDGTPTVITAVSSDPEEIPLTWDYAVTTGSMGTTATISQANNVFTITPSTNTSDKGNFGITISATDGINTVTAASNIILLFTEPAYYNFNVYGVTGNTSSNSYQVNGVSTAYTGGSTISNTTLSLDVARTIQYQNLPAGNGISLGSVDMTLPTNKDFTWQFFIRTSGAGVYHQVFNDGTTFNVHTFKYGSDNLWYWYSGSGYSAPAGTNHQGANTWYHMIIQGDYAAGTIHTWINTNYIGSSNVGTSFWDSVHLADYTNMTINRITNESYNMDIGEMKIWRGYQFYTAGQNTTWDAVFDT